MLIKSRGDYEIHDRVRWCLDVARKVINETELQIVDGVDVLRIKTWAKYLLESDNPFDPARINVLTRNEYFLNRALSVIQGNHEKPN